MVVTSGPSGATVTVHAGALRVREQPVERDVQAREAAGGVCAPCLGQRASEVRLLGHDVGGAIAQPLRLHQHDLRVGGNEVEQHVLRVHEPRQPRLHAVEGQTVGQALPLLAAPRLERDETPGTGADLVGRQQLAAREDPHFGEIVRRPLVVDGELREPVDLVAPQVDPDRVVRGRREHVDDRAADADLAAVLDLVLAAISRLHESRDQLVAVAPLAGPHLDRFDLVDVRAEPLHQRPDRGDDDFGRPGRVEQAPDGPQPAAHRLDTGTDTLERQRLPRGEQVDLVRSEVSVEVVGQTLGIGGGRDRDDVRTAMRGGDETGDRERSSRLGHGEERGRTVPELRAGRGHREAVWAVHERSSANAQPYRPPLLVLACATYMPCGQRTPKGGGH